jgi:hypothetical protein
MLSHLAHMPLAEETRLIAGFLQLRRKEDGSFRSRRVVIDDAMPVSVNASENRGTAWAAKGCGDASVLKVNSFMG